MKKLHFLIPIILLLSIVGSFIGIVYNLKFKHDELQGISKNQPPLYEANQLVVDENGNYYIGDGCTDQDNNQQSQNCIQFGEYGHHHSSTEHIVAGSNACDTICTNLCLRCV